MSASKPSLEQSLNTRSPGELTVVRFAVTDAGVSIPIPASWRGGFVNVKSSAACQVLAGDSATVVTYDEVSVLSGGEVDLTDSEAVKIGWPLNADESVPYRLQEGETHLYAITDTGVTGHVTVQKAQ